MVPARKASELQAHTWTGLSSQRNRRTRCGHRRLFTLDVAPHKTAHVSASRPWANHGDSQPSFISLASFIFWVWFCVCAAVPVPATSWVWYMHTYLRSLYPSSHSRSLNSASRFVSFRFSFYFFLFPFFAFTVRFSSFSLSASLSLLLLSTTPVHFARLSLWIRFLVLSIRPTSHRCHTAASLTFNRRNPPGFCLQAGITPATEEKSLPRFVPPSILKKSSKSPIKTSVLVLVLVFGPSLLPLHKTVSAV